MRDMVNTMQSDGSKTVRQLTAPRDCTASHYRDRATVSNLDHFARCKGSIASKDGPVCKHVLGGAAIEQ